MSLANHFLIATPKNPASYFKGALVYVCDDKPNSTWGFVVNRPGLPSVGELLLQMDMPASALRHTPTYRGGSDHANAGFVLHTGAPIYRLSYGLYENINLTTSKDILLALGRGGGALAYLLLLGMCRWQGGRLAWELTQGFWLPCPASAGLLFHPNNEQKLAQVYDTIKSMPTRLPIGNA